MSNAEPMGHAARVAAYRAQNERRAGLPPGAGQGLPFTAAQHRRMQRKVVRGLRPGPDRTSTRPAGWRGARVDTSAAAQEEARSARMLQLAPSFRMGLKVSWARSALAGLQQRQDQRRARRGRG